MTSSGPGARTQRDADWRPPEPDTKRRKVADAESGGEDTAAGNKGDGQAKETSSHYYYEGAYYSKKKYTNVIHPGPSYRVAQMGDGLLARAFSGEGSGSFDMYRQPQRASSAGSEAPDTRRRTELCPKHDF